MSKFNVGDYVYSTLGSEWTRIESIEEGVLYSIITESGNTWTSDGLYNSDDVSDVSHRILTTSEAEAKGVELTEDVLKWHGDKNKMKFNVGDHVYNLRDMEWTTIVEIDGDSATFPITTKDGNSWTKNGYYYVYDEENKTDNKIITVSEAIERGIKLSETIKEPETPETSKAEPEKFDFGRAFQIMKNGGTVLDSDNDKIQMDVNCEEFYLDQGEGFHEMNQDLRDGLFFDSFTEYVEPNKIKLDIEVTKEQHDKIMEMLNGEA